MNNSKNNSNKIKNSKFIMIDAGKIVELHSNGGRARTIIFQNERAENFKIFIESESHQHQSHASLYKWTQGDGFSLIIDKNPKRDFNIDISYKPQIDQKSFDPIIADLMKIAESF